MLAVFVLVNIYFAAMFWWIKILKVLVDATDDYPSILMIKQARSLSLNTLSMLYCPVLAVISSFVRLSFHKTRKMFLSHLQWAVSSLFISVTVGRSSALRGKVITTNASHNLVFTISLILMFLGTFFVFFWNAVAAFPVCLFTHFSYLPLYTMQPNHYSLVLPSTKCSQTFLWSKP